MGIQNTHTEIHTYSNLEQDIIIQGEDQKDFRSFFSYPSIHCGICVLIVLQQTMRFLGGKPTCTDLSIIKLKIICS